MTVHAETPREIEVDAERARVQIGETLTQLKQQLKPAHLVDEWSESNGFKDITAEKILDYTTRRHPVQTAVAGIGFGLLVYAAARRRGGKDVDGEQAHRGNFSVRTMLADLTATAATTFRERAESKRREVMDAAKVHVASAAQDIGDTVEKSIDEALTNSAVPEEARPVLVTTLQLLLAAAVESVLPRLAAVVDRPGTRR
jgi:hypothetical protein